MSAPESTPRLDEIEAQAVDVALLDEIEDQLADMRERIGRYRRAMLGSQVVILAGLAGLVAVYTVFPGYASPTFVVVVIAAVIGAIVWLGATKSSKEELDAALKRIEAERPLIFDRIAADNGWTDAPRVVRPAKWDR